MITDEHVNAALAVWYPGEWPDDPIFDKIMEDGPYAGMPWKDQVFAEMWGALEAATKEEENRLEQLRIEARIAYNENMLIRLTHANPCASVSSLGQPAP